jgi:hypothetical protein
MPVSANKLSTALQIKVKTGVDVSGNDITATQSYRRVKVNAADDALYSAAQTIGSLQNTPVVSVIRADSTELVNIA